MVGIFIGSFNPPTRAHLGVAIQLKDRFKKIIFVPVNSKEKKLISLNTRIEMLSLLKNKYSFLDIDNIMLDYSFMNYKIIDLLRKKYKDIVIIIGSDLLDKIDKFDNYNYLLNNYSFLVITRNGLDINKIINKKYYNYKDKFEIINYNSNISSSMVREYIKDGKDYSNLLDNDTNNPFASSKFASLFSNLIGFTL